MKAPAGQVNLGGWTVVAPRGPGGGDGFGGGSSGTLEPKRAVVVPTITFNDLASGDVLRRSNRGGHKGPIRISGLLQTQAEHLVGGYC